MVDLIATLANRCVHPRECRGHGKVSHQHLKILHTTRPCYRQSVWGGNGAQGPWGLKTPTRCEQEDSRRTLLINLPSGTSTFLLQPWRRGHSPHITYLPSEDMVWGILLLSGIHTEAHLQMICPHALMAYSWGVAVPFHLVTRGCLNLTAILL